MKKFNFYKTKTRICFSFPASPNDAFYSQLAMFRLALDSFGGIYKEADIVIVFGAEDIIEIPNKWRPHLNRKIIIHWAPIMDFNKKNYDAQGDFQWLLDYSKYDIVCILDADTLLIRPIDDLISKVLKNHSLNGTIAHYHFPIEKGETPKGKWNEIANEFIGKDIQNNYQHTLMVDQDSVYKNCPFYINFGFIIMTPEILKTISSFYLDIRPQVAKKLKNPYFSAQVSLALTVEYHNIKTNSIDLRYNFPNDEHADSIYGNLLDDIRLIHYLRLNYFKRHEIFTSRDKYLDFIGLELSGSNLIFQNFILNLTHGIYPFNDSKVRNY